MVDLFRTSFDCEVVLDFKYLKAWNDFINSLLLIIAAAIFSDGDLLFFFVVTCIAGEINSIYVLSTDEYFGEYAVAFTHEI